MTEVRKRGVPLYRTTGKFSRFVYTIYGGSHQHENGTHMRSRVDTSPLLEVILQQTDSSVGVTDQKGEESTSITNQEEFA